MKTYATRFQTQVQKLFGTVITPEEEERIAYQFIKGLAPTIRRFVLSAAPKILADAIKVAKDEEQNNIHMIGGYEQLTDKLEAPF